MQHFIKMQIEEVQSTTKAARIAAHTHIKCLGCAEHGRALPMAAGLGGGSKERRERKSSQINLHII